MSQIDTTAAIIVEDSWQQLLENTVDEETTNNLPEWWQYYNEKDLPINEVSSWQLTKLPILTPTQAASIINYRQQYGDFVGLFELQAVPGLDSLTIQNLLPFISLNKARDDTSLSLSQLFEKSKKTLYWQYARILNKQKGYTNNRYLGSPARWYLKYQQQYGKHFKLGITMEKDRGEPFFKGYNPKGFDFYSFHIAWQHTHPIFRTLIVGDYHLNIGQGLMLYSGFAFGGGLQTLNIRQTAPISQAFGGVQERRFLRGTTTTISLGNSWTYTPFISIKRIDGNFQERDSLRLLQSIDESGYHRTMTDFENKKTIREWLIGNSLQWTLGRNQHLRLSLANRHFNQPIILVEPELYEQYKFQGTDLFNLSIDYDVQYRSVSLFGEWASDAKDGWAFTQGVLVALNQYIGLAVNAHYFSPKYNAIYGNAFARRSDANNEQGLYIAWTIQPNQQWQGQFSWEQYRFPNFSFRLSRPARGATFRWVVNYQPHKHLQTYVSFLVNRKDATESSTSIAQRINDYRLRWHLSKVFNERWTGRTRFDLGYQYTDSGDKQAGVGLYQDVIYQPIGSPFTANIRLAWHNTTSYEVRFYNYERDVLNQYAIPAYYGKGFRYYINLRYRPITNWVIETKFGQNIWTDRTEVGSGDEAIDGSVRAELKVQLRVRF